MQVSGVLLAAGESTRMSKGRLKQLLPFDGEPLVRRIATAALASRLCELIVVVGFAGERVRRALAGLDVSLVENSHFRDGQSTSVKAGLAAVVPTANGALFLPADQPFLTSVVIDQIIETYQQTGAPIVLPVFQDRRGMPVLFDRSLFPELAQIAGDEGGRQIVRRHPEKVVVVPLDSELPLLDIDTAEDYSRLLEAV
ncbi:MAG: NTP transferase domain-containing protein [Anaerolineae bacterium]